MQFELTPFVLPNGYGDSIVSLDDMKAHLSFTDDEIELDGLIRFYRDAAIDMVERYCGVRLGECAGMKWRRESLEAPVRLGVWPITTLSAISWLDQTGETVTGTIGDWRVLRRDEIALKPGKVLPSTIAAGVEITFTAGFTAADRPPALVQAVKLFAAHLFLHREAVITGTISGEIPLGFKQLCGQFRVPVV